MADRVVITEPDAVTTIQKYGKQMELEDGDAAARLIGIARSRINALRKHAAKPKDEEGRVVSSERAKPVAVPVKAPAKPKAEKKVPAKKVPAKKAPAKTKPKAEKKAPAGPEPVAAVPQ